MLAAAAASDDGWTRVVAVFQPNRYNRMAVMSPDYADAFVDADVAVITDIYPSGQAPIPGVTGSSSSTRCCDAHPEQRVVVAAPAGRSRRVPRRRAAPRRRLHLDGLR